MSPADYLLNLPAAIDAVEWTGAIIGLLGALVLATNTRVSRWGWVAFLASNILLIVLALAIERRGLLIMQAGYFVTSLIGIWRTFHLAPPWVWLAGRWRVPAPPPLDCDGTQLSDAAAAALRARYAPADDSRTNWY